MIGNKYMRPEDAYRLAKDETLVVSGIEHSTGRPLDFGAVTDHSEYTGEAYSATYPDAPGYDSDQLKDLRAG